MSETPSQFYLGVARLPELGQSSRAVVVELEVYPGRNLIVGASVSPYLPGMQRVVERNLVGSSIDDAEHCLQRIQEQYHSPEAPALGTALRRALERAQAHS